MDEKDGKALIVTHEIIDCKYFDANNLNIYSNSTIREWLNNSFYDTAFNDDEKKIIKTTLVDNTLLSNGEINKNKLSKNTEDKLFLLSQNEVETYFKLDTDRIAKATDYATTQGSHKSSTGKWWLRTPLCNREDYAGYVEETKIYYCCITNISYGIRPACWIKLK